MKKKHSYRWALTFLITLGLWGTAHATPAATTEYYAINPKIEYFSAQLKVFPYAIQVDPVSQDRSLKNSEIPKAFYVKLFFDKIDGTNVKPQTVSFDKNQLTAGLVLLNKPGEEVRVIIFSLTEDKQRLEKITPYYRWTTPPHGVNGFPSTHPSDYPDYIKVNKILKINDLLRISKE